MFLADSTDPIAIDAALHASGEPGFQVKHTLDGIVHEGWVDFVGARGIEVTADKKLKLNNALKMANTLGVQLGAQSENGCASCGCPIPANVVLDQWGYFHCPEPECGDRLRLNEDGRPQGYTD